jgi:hypothetical protein
VSIPLSLKRRNPTAFRMAKAMLAAGASDGMLQRFLHRMAPDICRLGEFDPAHIRAVATSEQPQDAGQWSLRMCEGGAAYHKPSDAPRRPLTGKLSARVSVASVQRDLSPKRIPAPKSYLPADHPAMEDAP